MISLVKYTKSIKNRIVLDNINVSFEEGNVYLLTGHNGCGKTMLLRALCRLITPTSGSINYTKDYKFGVVIETPCFMNNESALYNLKYLANIRKEIGITEIETALSAVGLYDVRSDKVKSFSLGMKQRLGICQAMMENPDVILLDEPFNALDDNSCEIIHNLIEIWRNSNKIVVIAAHGIENTDSYDKIIKLNNGKIV